MKLLLLVSSGPALPARRRGSPGDAAGADSPHADAAQHHPDGPPAPPRLPSHRGADHRLLLLAHGHHRHHQSRAGEFHLRKFGCLVQESRGLQADTLEPRVPLLPPNCCPFTPLLWLFYPSIFYFSTPLLCLFHPSILALLPLHSYFFTPLFFYFSTSPSRLFHPFIDALLPLYYGCFTPFFVAVLPLNCGSFILPLSFFYLSILFFPPSILTLLPFYFGSFFTLNLVTVI